MGPAPPPLIPSLLATQVNGVNVVKVGHKQVVSLIRQGGNHLVMKVVSVSRKPESEDVVRKKGECRADPHPTPHSLRFQPPSRLSAALVGLEEGAPSLPQAPLPLPVLCLPQRPFSCLLQPGGQLSRPPCGKQNPGEISPTESWPLAPWPGPR